MYTICYHIWRSMWHYTYQDPFQMKDNKIHHWIQFKHGTLECLTQPHSKATSTYNKLISRMMKQLIIWRNKTWWKYTIPIWPARHRVVNDDQAISGQQAPRHYFDPTISNTSTECLRQPDHLIGYQLSHTIKFYKIQKTRSESEITK